MSTPAAEPLAGAARPTRVRLWVIGLVALISVFLYLDRFCISFAEIYIQQDLRLSNEQVGVILGAFFWTYALAQVPSGWLTDRFGARTMMTVYLLAWSVFTGLTGLASSFAALVLLRLGFGIAQAGAYPTSAALLSRWVPISSRGLASSLVAAGGRTGGALAPIATALLIVNFVPATERSMFVPADLLDVEHLRGELREKAHGDSGLAPWLLSQFSPSTRAWIKSPDVNAKTDDAVRTRLLAELNGVLLNRSLYREAALEPSTLPREGTALARRDIASLREHELVRLNRLTLEAAYPKAFRRIYVHGWRPVMWTYGLLGVPLALAFWWIFRNSPVEHPWCNAAEQTWVLRGKSDALRSSGERLVVPLKQLLTNRSMWLNCLSQFATNVGWIFLVTWLPRYLEERHRVPVEERAVMTSIPVLVGFVGMLLGGQLTDVLHRKLGRRWGRALPIGASRLIATAAYLLCLFDPAPWTAVFLFAMVAFATDLGVGATWAYVQDVGGRHVGSVLGWGNMWGNLGAAATPSLLIWIVGETHNWEAGFATCAFAFLVAALAGFGIDARDVIDAPPQHPLSHPTKPVLVSNSESL